MYKILIIDDEKKHLEATKEYLRIYGFEVFESQSAQEAFKVLERIKPDLIVLDIVMPNTDGYTFIKELRNTITFKTIPYIFVTAKGMTQDRIRGYSYGCSGYIPKPFDPDELIAIIKSILAQKSFVLDELTYVMREVTNLRKDLESHYELSQKFSQQLNLTPRELSVLEYISKGLRNKEIAAILNTSVRNVERYVTRLLSKTNTTNRTELVRYIYTENRYLRANDGNRTRE